MWGLIDRWIGVGNINAHTCDAVDLGHRTLTGQAPLRGYRDVC